MPQIGWFEIIIIVIIAIIVIGPKDFPFMLKKIGTWIGSIKKYVFNFQKEISELENETFETELKENINENKNKESNDKKTK